MNFSNSLFPNPLQSEKDGFLCWSDSIHVNMLVDAYLHGIFPWPQTEKEILWFSPKQRGVLDFYEYHQSKSYLKFKRKNRSQFEFRVDTNFDTVIDTCAAKQRPGQDGTWITSSVMDAYKELHKAGFAHSFEVYKNKQLIAGIYGVFVGGN